VSLRRFAHGAAAASGGAYLCALQSGSALTAVADGVGRAVVCVPATCVRGGSVPQAVIARLQIPRRSFAVVYAAEDDAEMEVYTSGFEAVSFTGCAVGGDCRWRIPFPSAVGKGPPGRWDFCAVLMTLFSHS